VPGEFQVIWQSLSSAFALAAAVSVAAYALRSLTAGGAVAATVTGGLTFGVGGVLPAALLLLFFVSSSALSRLGHRRKGLVGAQFEKSSRRDHWQVLANGGAATLLAVIYGISTDARALAALAGALAAVNADTWATEVGVLARRRPWRLTDGRRVDPGTSGAVSVEGTLACLAGAALIGVAGGLAMGSLALAGAATAGGFLGAAVDSLVGATVQAMYFCPACGKETERHPVHTCGTSTTRLRGWPWLRNDAVNLAASLVGAAVAYAGYLAWGGS
jgi:uncharacterized protein (TIGR00297 family)